MSQIIIDENEQKFLIELFSQTQGDVSRQVSMFAAGKLWAWTELCPKRRPNPSWDGN